MSHRFLLESEIRDGQAVLDGDQARHAIQVMRFKEGDRLVLFDGRGTEHVARIVTASKKQLQLEIESTSQTLPRLKRDITVAVALPKGDRQKFLVEKLVELGVRRMVPLQTVRSVATASEKVIQRIQRQVIEASKQCERNFLMVVEPQHSLDQLLNLELSKLSTTQRLVADPAAETSLAALQQGRADATETSLIAIGPEGGFDDAEMTLFTAEGWTPVNLGPTILRIETAAMVAAVLLGIGSGQNV